MAATTQILPDTAREHSPRLPKLTCRTCKLKKCVGRCHWETVPPAK
jgi:hypothetical protein